MDELLISKFDDMITGHYKANLYDKVLDDFRSIFSILKFDKTFSYYRYARTAFSRLNDRDIYQYYWYSLSTPLMIKATYLADDLIEGRHGINELISDFKCIVNVVCPNELIRESLINSYIQLVNSCLYKTSPDFKCIEPLGHRIYIIPSGYGWSGSGAILDFLKEFDNTSFIMGEKKLIESDISFNFFVKNINDRYAIFKHAVRFFFVNILGCYSIFDRSYYMPLSEARKRILKTKNINLFADLIMSISSVLGKIIIHCKLGDDIYSVDYIKLLLKDLAKYLLGLLTVDVSYKKIPVLNNIIHTYNLEIINYLEKVKVICSLRDPRSIYLSKINEDLSFKPNPYKFIENQKNIRNLIKTVDRNNDNCLFVNFEEFVIDKKIRDNLIFKLGLDKKNHVHENEFFKASESIENVRNFLKCSSFDSDIQLIFQELNEFCINESYLLSNFDS